MQKKKDRPEAGKIYALTDGEGKPCIANGNTWAQSEVKKDNKKEWLMAIGKKCNEEYKKKGNI